ncbi:MAG: sigma 54-dependent Fis family transcriptional regulator [Deltaproteobacteria bacterium]|nr:sigma 54-dependent Fis family transcriptional regulator [Deltaproteobacteria bacterium]
MNDKTATVGALYTDVNTGDLRSRRYLLRVISGPDKGFSLPLDAGSFLLGSHENNDIVLRDPTVSRYHLELQVRDGGVRVKDQESTNGTFVGKTRLGTITIRERTTLDVGHGETRIEILPADEAVSLDRFAEDHFGRAYGHAQVMRDVFSLLARVASTEATVLLEGETGTGKELLAEGLHEHSRREKGPFIVLDCGAVPRELLASELFGHRRGAFTGADQARQGLADAAQGGTLFLDEIGELPLQLQPQLLRLLEGREIRPIGDTRSHPVDVRVVAATHRDLRQMCHRGEFRDDLYYRLAVVRVPIPPLRKRREDIPPLVRLFAESLGRDDLSVPDAVMRQLQAHDWPGNVRELRNAVERSLSLATAQIMAASIDPSRAQNALGYSDALGDASAGSPSDDDGVSISDDMMDRPFKEAKGLLVETFERAYLAKLLARHEGNISAAAREAGIDRNYIHRMVKKYGLSVDR